MKESKKSKKKRISPIHIVGFTIVTVIAVFLGLLNYKPSGYQPVAPRDTDEVDRYFTHYLAPNFHNNISVDKPFEVIVLQDNINQFIAGSNNLTWTWPINLNGVTFYAPILTIQTDKIILMGKVDLGFSIIVTIEISPELDEQGLFTLNLDKVKAGALNITGFAKKIGGSIMASQSEGMKYKQWIKDLSGAFLENKPYDPVFPVSTYEKYIRLTKADLSDGKIVVAFEPAGDMED